MKIFIPISIFNLCLLFIISCSNPTYNGNDKFKINVSSDNDYQYLEITYEPKELFSNDSILYFSYEEFYPDTIRIFREIVHKYNGKFEIKRRFVEIPGNVEIKVSRFKELSTYDEFLFSKFEMKNEQNTKDDLITLLLTDSENLAQAIYDKYQNNKEYSFIVKILYGNFLIQNNLESKIVFNEIDSLASINIKSKNILYCEFLSLLYLKMVGHNTEEIQSINLNHLYNDSFPKLISTFEYLFLRNIYARIYPYRIEQDFNSIDYETNLFMLKELNENSNYIFTNFILRIIEHIKINQNDSSKLDTLINQIFFESLDYFKYIDCDRIKENYYFDLPYTFFSIYKLFPASETRKVVSLLLNYSQCVLTDSWLNTGYYTNGYDLEFGYSIKSIAIRELISIAQDSIALEIINDFKNSNYEYNKFTNGAINIIHLIGSEVYIKNGNLKKAKEYITILAKIKSPQLRKIISEYNSNVSYPEIDTININDLIYHSDKVGKIVRCQYIKTNNGNIRLETNKKYLFLFFNEDCNACNFTINEIVLGIKKYDTKGDIFETIIVSDNVRKIKEEYPGQTLAINPSELRKELDYYSKSGTIMVEDLRITYDSPNVPANTSEFLDYIFNYVSIP